MTSQFEPSCTASHTTSSLLPCPVSILPMSPSLARLDGLHAGALALRARQPQHNLLGGLGLKKEARAKAGNSSESAARVRLVQCNCWVPSVKNAPFCHAAQRSCKTLRSALQSPCVSAWPGCVRSISSKYAKRVAPSCGRRAWSARQNPPACGRTAACLRGAGSPKRGRLGACKNTAAASKQLHKGAAGTPRHTSVSRVTCC